MIFLREASGAIPRRLSGLGRGLDDEVIQSITLTRWWQGVTPFRERDHIRRCASGG
jgi:hypothetical protein